MQFFELEFKILLINLNHRNKVCSVFLKNLMLLQKLKPIYILTNKYSVNLDFQNVIYETKIFKLKNINNLCINSFVDIFV